MGNNACVTSREIYIPYQSQKGRENILVANTNRRRGERIYLLELLLEQLLGVALEALEALEERRRGRGFGARRYGD
eukprot:5887177-Pyramimonas_sp.AAC.1